MSRRSPGRPPPRRLRGLRRGPGRRGAGGARARLLTSALPGGVALPGLPLPPPPSPANPGWSAAMHAPSWLLAVLEEPPGTLREGWGWGGSERAPRARIARCLRPPPCPPPAPCPQPALGSQRCRRILATAATGPPLPSNGPGACSGPEGPRRPSARLPRGGAACMGATAAGASGGCGARCPGRPRRPFPAEAWLEPPPVASCWGGRLAPLLAALLRAGEPRLPWPWRGSWSGVDGKGTREGWLSLASSSEVGLKSRATSKTLPVSIS